MHRWRKCRVCPADAASFAPVSVVLLTVRRGSSRGGENHGRGSALPGEAAAPARRRAPKERRRLSVRSRKAISLRAGRFALEEEEEEGGRKEGRRASSSRSGKAKADLI